MRILFLTPRFPLPAVKGDKLRAWQFIRLLSARHEVTLLSYIGGAEEREFIGAVEAVCRTVAVPFRKAERAMGLLRGCWTSDPFQVALYHSAEMKSRVIELLQESDVVHCNTLRMVSNLPSGLSKPCFVDFIDALSATYAQKAEEALSPKDLAFRLEASRLRTLEQRLIGSARFTCAVSEEDAAALGVGVHVVPHGIDTTLFCPPLGGRGAVRANIIFTGNLRYPPNVEAAVILAQEIFPNIRKAIPEARLRIVGINPAAEVRKLAGDGIEVTGYVPNIADELRRSAIAIAPVRSGGGVKTKVLEAMGCGTPVVASAIAMSGIPVESGEHAVIADDPSIMADDAVALMTDPERAERIGNAGRRLVEKHFSWQATGKALLDAYDELEDELDTR